MESHKFIQQYVTSRGELLESHFEVFADSKRQAMLTSWIHFLLMLETVGIKIPWGHLRGPTNQTEGA